MLDRLEIFHQRVDPTLAGWLVSFELAQDLPPPWHVRSVVRSDRLPSIDDPSDLDAREQPAGASRNQRQIGGSSPEL